MDRRRNPQAVQSPIATLEQMPALVVLERIPIPVLAIAGDGAVIFANAAFAQMVGRSRGDVLAMRFAQLFVAAPTADSVLSAVHSLANVIVTLAHRDGSAVRALMSRSALQRADDKAALATFQDLTEQLWHEGR